MDREHASLIEENERTAEDIGVKIRAAEENYDAMAKDDPRRPPLYARIVEARKIGADAAKAAGELRIERQGLQAEQQEVQRQSTVISGEIQGSVSFLVEFGAN